MSVYVNPALDEMLGRVARQLLAERDIVLIPASREILDGWSDWSEPVSVRAVASDDGTYELEVREVREVRQP